MFIETGEGENAKWANCDRVCITVFFGKLLFPCEQNKMVAVSLYGSEIILSVEGGGKGGVISSSKNVQSRRIVCKWHEVAIYRIREVAFF